MSATVDDSGKAIGNTIAFLLDGGLLLYVLQSSHETGRNVALGYLAFGAFFKLGTAMVYMARMGLRG